MIVLKTSFDAKTQQIVRQLKFSNGTKLRVFGELGPDVRQMYSLAKFGLDIMIARVQSGIGADDQIMPGLQRGYAIRKTREGKGNKRNLTYSVEMLRNISIRSVSATQARIDLTSTKQRTKARSNEEKSPWWGWSPRNVAQLVGASNGMLRAQVAEFGIAVGVGRGRGAMPIWMDPRGIRAMSGRLAA